jgi:hypothetical protein
MHTISFRVLNLAESGLDYNYDGFAAVSFAQACGPLRYQGTPDRGIFALLGQGVQTSSVV